MKQMLAAVVAMFGLALPASAGPLDKGHVSAEAKWLVHVDFEAFSQTKLAEHIRKERLDEPRVQRWLDWAEQRYGIDLRDDFHSMTLYGKTYEPYRGVAILAADFEKDKIVDVLKGQRGYRTTEHRDYTLHTWVLDEPRRERPGIDARERRERPAVEPRERRERAERPALEPRERRERAREALPRDDRQRHMLSAAFHDGKVLIAGTLDEMRHALDVLDGDQPGLPDDSPLLAERPEGTVFYGAGKDLGALAERDEPASRFGLLKQAELLTIAIGEHEGKAFEKARFQAVSEEAAEQLKRVLDGFAALLTLQGEAFEPLKRVAEGLEVSVEEKTVRIDWEADADDVLAVFKERREAREALPLERRDPPRAREAPPRKREAPRRGQEI